MVIPLKEKVLDSLIALSRIVTFGIRLAITFVVETAIIMAELNNFSYNMNNGGQLEYLVHS